jgi:Domain of unknown function (DUF4440)
MTKAFIFLALLVPASLRGQSSSEKEVLALHYQKFRWLTAKNYDSIRFMMHPKVAYIHSNGWIENAEEVIQDLKSGKLNYVSIDVQEASAKQSDQCVVVTGKGLFKGITQGTEFSIPLLYTEVYVKHKKKWLLLQRHANRLP